MRLHCCIAGVFTIPLALGRPVSDELSSGAQESFNWRARATTSIGPFLSRAMSSYSSFLPSLFPIPFIPFSIFHTLCTLICHHVPSYPQSTSFQIIISNHSSFSLINTLKSSLNISSSLLIIFFTKSAAFCLAYWFIPDFVCVESCPQDTFPAEKGQCITPSKEFKMSSMAIFKSIDPISN